MMQRRDSRLSSLNLDDLWAALGIEAGGAGPRTPYTVLRGPNGPRWLLPNQGAITQTILREWRPYGLSARAFWFGLNAAAHVGAWRWIPRTEQAWWPPDAGSRMLRHFGIKADASTPAILVGNTVATRKLLVFFEEPGAGAGMVLKVPLTPLARASICHEAEALKKLDGRHRAPRLLHLSPEAGAAAQEYLPGRLGSRRCKPHYVRLLLEFIQPGIATSLRARGEQLRERLRLCPDYCQHAERIDSALSYLEDDAAAPLALSHGDFAPWNIRELPDGNCTVIDWELARWDGIALFDLCHFYYMQCLLFAPGRLFYDDLQREGACKEYCAALALPASLVPRLAAAFLLEMMAYYWETADPIAAFGLRQLESFLQHVTRPDR